MCVIQLQISIQISIWSSIRHSTVLKRVHNRHFLTFNWFSSLQLHIPIHFNKISIWSPIRHSTVLERVHNRHFLTYIWFSNHSDFTTAFNLATTRRAYCSATSIVTQAWHKRDAHILERQSKLFFAHYHKDEFLLGDTRPVSEERYINGKKTEMGELES